MPQVVKLELVPDTMVRTEGLGNEVVVAGTAVEALRDPMVENHMDIHGGEKEHGKMAQQ